VNRCLANCSLAGSCAANIALSSFLQVRWVQAVNATLARSEKTRRNRLRGKRKRRQLLAPMRMTLSYKDLHGFDLGPEDTRLLRG
jgi:hypothetical protein